MGCDEPLPHEPGQCFQFHGVWIDRCPAYYISRSSEWIAAVFELHGWREKGFLPGNRAYDEQPSINVQILGFVDLLQAEKVKRWQKNSTST